MKILLAPDSFKGTLTALQVCQIIRDELQETFTVDSHPLADGGEGTLLALAACLTSAQWIKHLVCGPLPSQPVEAAYLWLPESQVAVVEMAQASGLTLLTPSEQNPELTTTYGTGELITQALARHPQKVILALGGSATNDAGLGMLMALGWQCLDANSDAIPLGGQGLSRLQQIIPPSDFKLPPVELWSDVTNPLYGPQGAAYVYGPQKGADSAMVERLDLGLRNVAQILKQETGFEANFPGAGAAGGLGAGAVWGLQAQLKSGFQAIAELTGLEQKLQACDLVITGEGFLDVQSWQGKVVSGVWQLAQKYGKPLVILAGQSSFEHYPGVAQIISLVGPDISAEQACQSPASALKQRCQELKKSLVWT
ncbi:glycerate kinase [Synechocystis sp. LKSZ1]|uniref:glycerate kinase n=1 Tax=Synechocystis sp. LKSZ1 TaxID=3144951 RepID=UPI00336BB020